MSPSNDIQDSMNMKFLSHRSMPLIVWSAITVTAVAAVTSLSPAGGDMALHYLNIVNLVICSALAIVFHSVRQYQGPDGPVSSVWSWMWSIFMGNYVFRIWLDRVPMSEFHLLVSKFGEIITALLCACVILGALQELRRTEATTVAPLRWIDWAISVAVLCIASTLTVILPDVPTHPVFDSLYRIPTTVLSVVSFLGLGAAVLKSIIARTSKVPKGLKSSIRTLSIAYVVSVFGSYSFIQLYPSPSPSDASLVLGSAATVLKIPLGIGMILSPVIFALIDRSRLAARAGALNRFLDENVFGHFVVDDLNVTLESNKADMVLMGTEKIVDCGRSQFFSDINEESELLRGLRATKKPGHHPTRFRRVDGQDIWVDLFAQPMFRNGEYAGYEGLYRNRTDEVETKMLGEAMQAMLVSGTQLDKSLRRLFNRYIRAVGANSGFLLVKDASGSRLEPIIYTQDLAGVEPDSHSNRMIKQLERQGARCLPMLGAPATGRCVLSDSLAGKPCRCHFSQQYKTCAFVPFYHSENMVAVLWVFRQHSWPSSKDRVSRHTQFSRKVSTALEMNSGLDVSALYEFVSKDNSKGIPGATDVDQYTNAIARSLISRISVGSWFVVRRVSSPKSRVVLSAASPNLFTKTTMAGVVVESAPTKSVAEQGEDLNLDANFGECDVGELFDVKIEGCVELSPARVLGVPILDRFERPVGAIFLLDRHYQGAEQPFTVLDREIADEYAKYLGLLLETAAWEERIRLHFRRITHEFVSPVVGIAADTERALDYLRCGKYDKVERNLVFMDALALSLKYLVRMALAESDEYSIVREMKDVKLGSILNPCRAQLKPWLVERGFSLRSIVITHSVHLEPIHIDPESIGLVVFNVIRNAIKYSDKGPNEVKIQVAAEVDDEWVFLRFVDNGIGIPEGWEERIFELGERTPEAEDMDARGLGVGLTWVRHIMQLHGGDAILENRKDPTVLTCKFPASRLASNRRRK